MLMRQTDMCVVYRHVDLQMNQITDVGCKALAEGIPKNKGLKRLYRESWV